MELKPLWKYIITFSINSKKYSKVILEIDDLQKELCEHIDLREGK